MITENTVAVRSVTEALVAARQAQKAGRPIPIAPCVRVDATGNTVICPKLDQTLRVLCKDPDGPGPTNGSLECPLQYGPLTQRTNGVDHATAIQALKPPVPSTLGWSRKERRPYFVQ